MKNKDEDVDLIDIFEDKNKPVVEIEKDNKYAPIPTEENLEEQEEEEQKVVQKKVVKRKLKKKLLFQTCFCLISAIFIIGCCIFYGTRFIKYYRLYNPKDKNGKAISLLGNHITSSATFVYEGEGLYLTGGNYIFKGEKVDNYVKYSGLIWRIIKINEDKSIDIILDQSINSMKWNNTISDYSDSDINKYLNEIFLPNLNKDLITTTTICNDKINTTKDISCKEPNTENYVRLLNIDEFLNSSVGEKSFISNGNNIWLSSRGDTNTWTINGSSLSYAEPNNTYNIKPVVTLKNTDQVLGGKGTKESPYEIDKKENEIIPGSYIKLGEDTWTVYNVTKDEVYLTLTSLYEDGKTTYRFDTTKNTYDPTSKSSLAEYLNTTFYDSLSYKDKLIETVWNTGIYDESYKDIYKETVKAKVGIPSIIDFKFDDAENYYIMNGTKENKSYIYKGELAESKPALSRGIKPSICIKKTKIKSGDGSVKTPYVLEG